MTRAILHTAVIVLPAVVLLACSGDSAPSGTDKNHGSNFENGSGGSSQVELNGVVTNPVTSQQHGRLVVGLVPNAKFIPPIPCSAFLARYDQADVSLPNTYDLKQVPLGDYLLVAMLTDSSSPSAPFTAYPVKVDADGVYYKSAVATTSIDLIMQGSVAYDCP